MGFPGDAVVGKRKFLPVTRLRELREQGTDRTNRKPGKPWAFAEPGSL